MQTLWAPWRMEYILSEKEKECIFCLALSDDGNLALYKGSLSMVMMNKYPYINGHILVAPVKHVSGLDKLSNEESMDLLLTVGKSIEVLNNSQKILRLLRQNF